VNNSFPAVIIGGPPHSGKSVLTYLLTQQLRAWKVEHYVLRACPDGEGDWSQEAPPDTVHLLRQKGQFSTRFVDRVCTGLAQRHLPLLVDVGGSPTPDQERILDFCTHAILLAPDDEGLATWRARAEHHGLAIIAELHSTLHGQDILCATGAVLRGQIAALERHTATLERYTATLERHTATLERHTATLERHTATLERHTAAGSPVAALAERLRDLLTYELDDLRRRHLDAAPTELAVDIEQIAAWLDASAPPGRLNPTQLPAALTYLPVEALSLHGRGPNWFYAALALHVAPHPFFLFDARLGWTPPVSLALSASAQAAHIAWNITCQRTHTHIALSPVEPYLDYDEIRGAELPLLDAARGVVLSGRLPHWLLVGAALAYRTHPWIAIMQAQANHAAVVVSSRKNALLVGDIVPVNGGG